MPSAEVDPAIDIIIIIINVLKYQRTNLNPNAVLLPCASGETRFQETSKQRIPFLTRVINRVLTLYRTLINMIIGSFIGEKSNPEEFGYTILFLIY